MNNNATNNATNNGAKNNANATNANATNNRTNNGPQDNKVKKGMSAKDMFMALLWVLAALLAASFTFYVAKPFIMK